MTACTCKPGQQRDNCPQCEGTGRRIAPDVPGYGAARRLAHFDRRAGAAPYAGADRRSGTRRRARFDVAPVLGHDSDGPDAFAIAYCAGCVDN